jgi:transposase-like protein
MPVSSSTISLARGASRRHDPSVTSRDAKPPKSRAAESVPPAEKQTRRVFTAAEKLRILEEADACERGQLGEVLRRHGIYSSHLVSWRKQLRLRGREGLGPQKPGRKAKRDNKDARIAELEKKLARSEKQLSVAKSVIEFQKKVSAMLEDDSEGES